MSYINQQIYSNVGTYDLHDSRLDLTTDGILKTTYNSSSNQAEISLAEAGTDYIDTAAYNITTVTDSTISPEWENTYRIDLDTTENITITVPNIPSSTDGEIRITAYQTVNNYTITFDTEDNTAYQLTDSSTDTISDSIVLTPSNNTTTEISIAPISSNLSAILSMEWNTATSE